MTDLNKVDVLFVGAGPSSLAGAIKLKQLLKQNNKDASVVIIEKSDKLGQHNLSGAVFESHVLDELIPDWKESKHAFITKLLGNKVEKDELLFLTSKSTIKLSGSIVPKSMHHKGDYTLSLSEMVKWLSEIAIGLGIEIYTGFAAKEVLIENNIVKGVRLGEKGLDKDKKPLCNYISGEKIEARVTIFGEGSLGQLSEQVMEHFNLRKDKNIQIHSVGVKEIIKLPEKNNFGTNRVIHTLGYPNHPSIFGGGTVYSMSENTVAVALIMALDWKYSDLNPQQELQVFKAHPYISKLLEGGEVVAYGAKTLPEGGYYAIADLVTDGSLIVGDSAGFTNPQKLKGLHYAIKSGILAGETIFEALQKGAFSKQELKKYSELLENSFVMKDLKAARNYRQVFNSFAGIYAGAPLTFIQGILPRQKTHHDYAGMKRTRLNRKFEGGIDRLTDVSLSGTIHSEDEPSHITFASPDKCQPCINKFGVSPCQYFCPGEVYRLENNEIILSPSNCLHCQTCKVKCPLQNIKWEVPEGSDGPKYKVM